MDAEDEAAERFLASLPQRRDWNKRYKQINRWASAGRAGLLLRVAAALADESYALPIEDWERQALLDRVEQALVGTARLDNVTAALNVSAMRDTRGAAEEPYYFHRRHREMAALLARGQTPDVLQALFQRHREEDHCHEVLACLVQEMILRGAAITGAAEDFWKQRVVAAHHPLGWLPLTLLPLEQTASPCPSAEAAEAASPPIAPATRWGEASVPETEAAWLRSAVVNWERDSNGLIESRILRSDVPMRVSAITSALSPSLPLECLAGETASSFTLRPVSAAEAFSSLMSAARNGGAYASGEGGAYGRLHAWRSVGGFVGARESDSVQVVAEQAEGCAWFLFPQPLGWFYNVVWDLGLMALRPDGRTLAVLAATDTD